MFLPVVVQLVVLSQQILAVVVAVGCSGDGMHMVASWFVGSEWGKACSSLGPFKNAFAASITGFVLTPVDSILNNPGSILPSEAMPRNGSANDASPPPHGPRRYCEKAVSPAQMTMMPSEMTNRRWSANTESSLRICCGSSCKQPILQCRTNGSRRE